MSARRRRWLRVARELGWISGLGWALVLGCSKPAAEPPQPPQPESREQAHRDEPEHEELPTRVKLAPAVIAAADVRTEPVREETLAVTLALPGELVADPDRTARIASPVAGRIERVLLQEGKAVAKGDPLAVIRVPDLDRIRASYAATLGKAKAARANAVRLKELFEHRLASEQSYLDAASAADALELEAGATLAQLSALGLGAGKAAPSALTLRAPISGVIIMRKAVVGQPVTAEQVIADIVDLSELWFLGRVFEKDLGRLHVHAKAEVLLNAYPKEHFEGAVEYIGQQVDPVARTVTARIRLENRADLLRVGLFGTAYVSTSEPEPRGPTLVVPRSALTEIAGKSVVFVRQADQDFELHELTLGDSAAGKVQVLAGLREGEQVAVDGVFTLKSAVLKSTIAEEE